MLLYRHTIDIKTHYVAVLAFLIMFLLPLGSDYYIATVGIYSLYLAVPLALGLLWKFLKAKPLLYRYLTVASLSIIFVIGAYRTMFGCYRDSGSRFKKTAVVTESEVQTTLTHPNKAQILNNVLEHVKPYKNAETELLAFPSVPMINYMTNTKPFVSNSWIAIMPCDLFKRELLYGEQHKPLPIIVISKALSTLWWDTREWRNIMDCMPLHPDLKENNIALNNFVLRHSYRVEYDDDYFQVLIPELK